MKKKIDLEPYMIESKFKREFNTFFGFWESIMLKRSRNTPRIQKRIEVFYGDVLGKFESLDTSQQEVIINSEFPFKRFATDCKLDIPQLFEDRQDNEEWMEVLNTHRFKK